MKIRRLSVGRVSIGSLNIGNRLKVGLGLIIAFMVLLIMTGVWSLGVINAKLDRIINVNNTKISLAYQMQSVTGTIDKSLMTSMIARDQTTTATEQKRATDAAQIFTQSLARLEKLETTPKGKEIIAQAKTNFEVAQQANQRVSKLLSDGDTDQATSMIIGIGEITKMLTESCDELVRYQQDLTAKAAAEARATYSRASSILLVAGALVLAFAAFLSIYLKNSITKPLSKAVSIAHTIAEGDLTVRIDHVTSDETGELLRAVKNMVEGLQRIIGEVKAVAADMADASQKLSGNSELMTGGAEEQAVKATQVATASEEMSHTVLEIAKNTSGIAESATETAMLAKNGEAVVDRSVEKVKAIAKTIEESGKLIRLLGERSNQIGAILNVINEIADQTNLLALNAAIEAARAGDAGRGFAVVADEVRKLAERTANSTSEIGEMIRAIQEEVSRMVSSMDGVTVEVRSGVDLSSQAGDVLRHIVESVDELHVMVQQIASATEQMAATSHDINKDIETIAAVSKETSGSSGQINEAARKLSEMSINLEGVVRGFKV